MGIPKEGKEKGTDIFKTMMVKKLPKAGEKKMDIQIHESQRSSDTLNPNRAALR